MKTFTTAILATSVLVLTGCQTVGGTRVSESHAVSKYPIEGYHSHIQGVYKDYSHAFVADPTGTASSPNVERIEVRNGDCWGRDCKGQNTGIYRERTETRLIPISGNYGYGKTVWYGVDLYIPKESVVPLRKGQTTITQTMIGKRKPNDPIKALFDLPTFELSTQSGMLQAKVFSDKNTSTKLTVAKIDDMADKWTRFEWVINQTNGSDGFVKVYVNGKLEFEHTGDSAMTRGDVAQLKYGIYTGYFDFTPEYYAKHPDVAAGTRIIYADNPAIAFKREDLFKSND